MLLHHTHIQLRQEVKRTSVDEMMQSEHNGSENICHFSSYSTLFCFFLARLALKRFFTVIIVGTGSLVCLLGHS